ncbi:MAG: cyclic pyranopterin monophosphate synthase MoaC, partial [Novosphingobium sp.]
MTDLTHLDEDGRARMVDVAAKPTTRRTAVARGVVTMAAAALDAIRDGAAPKGDVLAAARIAGIMAAKKTAELIPLCHPLALDSVTLDFAFVANGVEATATVALEGRT